MNTFRPHLSVAALLLALLLLFSCTANDGTVPSLSSQTTVPLTTVGEQTALTTVTTEPITSEPITSQPITSEPVTSEPITSEPITSEPVTSEPITSQPVTSEPITSQPITSEPVTSEPVTSQPITSQPAPDPYAQLARNAAYVLLYDVTEGRTLYTTGSGQRIYPASTTKLLTLHFAYTLMDESAVFTVGSEIDLAPWDSSKANLRKGEQYTLTDLTAAMLLPSGNDAAYTLAAHCGRLLAEDESLSAKAAVARFMEGLNAYAASLGLDGTHFVTPDGYHDEAHVTTMEDILQIALLARSHPQLARIMAMATYRVTDLATGRTQTWKNSNLLLQSSSQYYFPSANGCKTGFHTPAGACLIASAQKNGRELMVLIFKCSDKNARFADAKNFLELGFSVEGAA